MSETPVYEIPDEAGAAVHELLCAVREGRAEVVPKLVGALSVAERRACVPVLKAWRALTRDHWGEGHGAVRRAMFLAGAGCCTGAAAAAQWLGNSELRWASDDPEPVLEALGEREPAWLEQVAYRLAERRTVAEEEYPLIARLVLAAGCAPPLTDGFVLGWEAHMPGRGAPLEDRLRNDPFLTVVVPRLFEVPEAGGDFQYSYHGQLGWAAALARLAEEGRLSRAMLLDGCLSRLPRGGRLGLVKGFLALLTALDPTEEERAAHTLTWVRMVPDCHPMVAAYAQEALAGLDAAGLLATEHLVESSQAALFRPEKKVVRAQLALLDKAVKRDRARTDVLLPVAAEAFGHEEHSLQERALALTVRHRKHASPTVLAALAAAAQQLTPDLRARAEVAFGDVPAADTGLAAGESVASRTTADGSASGETGYEFAADGSTLAGDRAPAGDGAPVGTGTSTCAAPPIAAAPPASSAPPAPSATPASSAPPTTPSDPLPLVPGPERLGPDSLTPAELAEEVAALRRGNWEGGSGGGTPAQWERALNSLVVHAHTDLVGVRAALEPLVARWRREQGRQGDYWSVGVHGWDGLICAVMAVTDMVTARDLDHVRYWALQHSCPHSATRSVPLLRGVEIGVRLNEGSPLPFLLATPTWSTGTVDPSELVARLAAYEAAGTEPGAADLDQALLRLDRDIPAEASEAAARLTSPAGRRLAALLGAGGLPDPAVSRATERIRLRTPRPGVLVRTEAFAGTEEFSEPFRTLLGGIDPLGEPCRCAGGDCSPQALALLPRHREVIAARMLVTFGHMAEFDSLGEGVPALPALAESDGPAGPATHLLLAYGLGARRMEEQLFAVDALLVLAARDGLDAAELGRGLADLAVLRRIKLQRVVAALREVARTGAYGTLWAVLAGALPGLLNGEPPHGLSALLTLAAEAAEQSGARGAIPEIDALAARSGSSQTIKQARRIKRATGRPGGPPAEER